MPKKPHPADAFNDAVIAAAVWWTAFNQANGRVRHDFQTRAEAEAEARRLADASNRPSLVYAINREGRSALACTINPGRGDHHADEEHDQDQAHEGQSPEGAEAGQGRRAEEGGQDEG